MIVSDGTCGSEVMFREVGVRSGEVLRMETVACTVVVCSVLQIVVQDQVLDALLFGALGLLLGLHRDGKVRVGGEIDGASL